MAKKSCALIGPGEGPKVHVGGGGALAVRGMEDGEGLTLVRFNPDAVPEFHAVRSNGIHIFEPCQFVQVRYTGRSKKMICTVILGVSDAVFSH